MIAVKKLILPFVCPAFLYSDAGIITRPVIQPRGGGIIIEEYKGGKGSLHPE